MVMLLGCCSALMAQQQDKMPIDSPDKGMIKEAAIEMQTDSTAPKTESKKADKKKKKEKVDKKAAPAEPKPGAQSIQPDSSTAVIDSTQATGKKAKKPQKSKQIAKVDPKKDKKPEKPRVEPHAKPGAEADANAKVKDPIDRTRKGPSGQKVYIGPHNSLYYINSNGQKVNMPK